MAKRASLAGNVTKPDAGEAAKIAKKLAGKPTGGTVDQSGLVSRMTGMYPTDAPEYETVSYNLPLDLIDLCRDLAAERHRIDQAAKRDLRRRIKAAKKAGQAIPADTPPQARQSASAVIREALEAHRDVIVRELDELQGR